MTARARQILASGVSVPWALEAQRVLAEDWGVSADVWSVTSWTELRRDGMAAEEEAFLNPGQPARVPFVTQQLAGATGPIVAVTDYMKAVPDQIRQFLPNEFASLGADGFGFSDTRAAARRFFKNDIHSIVVRSLQMLARRGEVDAQAPAQAIEKYRLLQRQRRHHRQRGRRLLSPRLRQQRTYDGGSHRKVGAAVGRLTAPPPSASVRGAWTPGAAVMQDKAVVAFAQMELGRPRPVCSMHGRADHHSRKTQAEPRGR